jgi:hypothetical protein
LLKALLLRPLNEHKFCTMSDSEIRLKLIRLIISLKGDVLQELYEIILSKLHKKSEQAVPISPFELGYKEMAEDLERESDALEWIEGSFNMEGL